MHHEASARVRELAVGTALAVGTVLMAWATLGAARDFAASPGVAGGLRLVVEAVALTVLAGGTIHRWRSRRSRV